MDIRTGIILLCYVWACTDNIINNKLKYKRPDDSNTGHDNWKEKYTNELFSLHF